MTHFADQDLIAHYLTTRNERSFEQLYDRYRCLVYQQCLIP